MTIKSGLTRSLDLSHRSNAFVVWVTFGAGLVGAAVAGLIGDAGLGAAARQGVSAGGAAFVAWAIARELDPDRPAGAVAAAVLAPFTVIAADPDLLASGLMIVAARVVAGTTGRRLRLIDLVVLGIWAALIGIDGIGTPVGLMAGIAPAVSGWWNRASARVLFAASAATLAAVVAVAAAFALDRGPWTEPAGFARGLLVAGLAAGLVGCWLVPAVRSAVDSRHRGIISTHRVRLARVATLSAAVGTVLWAGGPGVMALAPVWVALGAVAVFSIVGLGTVGRS